MVSGLHTLPAVEVLKWHYESATIYEQICAVVIIGSVASLNYIAVERNMTSQRAREDPNDQRYECCYANPCPEFFVNDYEPGHFMNLVGICVLAVGH